MPSRTQKLPADNCHLITLTVVDWIDLFTNLAYRQIITGSLNHFTERQGLIIYSWCLMTNQLHLVVKTSDEYGIALFERDFKKYSTAEIVKAIDHTDLRQDWMMDRFENFGKSLKKIEKYVIWQNCCSPLYLDYRQPNLLMEKISFVHAIPVQEHIVELPEHYLYSSARDYVGVKGPVRVTVLKQGLSKFKMLSEN
ncbi:MAG TPA: hypothetical protein VK563_21275 [Puia sp.]|nr:hypothetical protein [Puia sp.]